MIYVREKRYLPTLLGLWIHSFPNPSFKQNYTWMALL